MARVARRAAGALVVAWLASCGSADKRDTPTSTAGSAGAPSAGVANDGGARPMREGGAGGYEAGGPAVVEPGGGAGETSQAGAGGAPEECSGSCTPDTTRCESNAQRECVRDESGCGAWGDPAPCASGHCASATACQPVATEDGQCSSDGWCWVQPNPHGHALLAMARAGGHVWAVGEGGELVHRDQEGHFTTERWPGLPTLHAVLALSAEDVWAVGAKGLILHHTAGGWSQVASGTAYDLYAIVGFAADDIVVGGGDDVTTNGVLLRYDGGAFGAFDIGGVPSSVHSLGGTSRSDLYVGSRGLGGAFIHYDGHGFTYVTDLLSKLDGWQNLTAIASFAGDLYVATNLNDGKLWRRHDGTWQSVALGVAEPIYSLQPTADQLYVVSDSGLRSYDGATFSPELAVQARGAGAVVASGSEVWVSGQGGRIFQKSEQGFELVYGSDFPGAGTDALLAVRSEDDIFWVSGKTLHFDGNVWQESPFPLPLNSQALFAGKTSLWATSSEKILLWSGTDWVTQYTAPTYMHAVWAAENGEVWAAGLSAPVHFDGQAWSVVSSAPITQTVDALHGTAHDDVWAVANSFIYHYDGNVWARVVAPIVGTDWLTTVNAISPTSVWFGGSNGKYYHFDGNDFTRFDGAPGYWITSMAAISDTDVWAIETTQTPHGYVSHFDGTRWTAMDTGCAHPLNQIYVQDADTVWAAGRGALLRWKRP